jgi:hypothetical protein
MEAVKAWCDASAVGLTLEHFPSGSASDCWRAWIPPHADAHGDRATAALMARRALPPIGKLSEAPSLSEVESKHALRISSRTNQRRMSIGFASGGPFLFSLSHRGNR